MGRLSCLAVVFLIFALMGMAQTSTNPIFLQGTQTNPVWLQGTQIPPAETFTTKPPTMSDLRIFPTVKYPNLARQARIQGMVKLRMSVVQGKSQIAVISGHPLLVPAAIEDVKAWKIDPYASGNLPSFSLDITYQFILLDPLDEERRQPRGDALDRLFLRLFRRKTYTVVSVCTNINEPNPPWSIIATPDHTGITVNIWGVSTCLQTESSQVVAE